MSLDSIRSAAAIGVAIAVTIPAVSHAAQVPFPDPMIPSGLGTAALAVGDLNADDHLDFVVTNIFAAEHAVMLGAGDGTFSNAIAFGVNFSGDTRSVAVADFDGDGFEDIVAADTSANTVSLYLGNGDGTFAEGSSTGVGNFANFLVVGDFDGNGNPDVAVTNVSSDDVSILLGDGDGGFAESRVEVEMAPYGIATADLNGDMNSDLVVANRLSDTVSVLLGNGDGTFDPQQSYATGAWPLALAISDFNEDGKLDVAVTNQSGGDLSLLLGTVRGQLSPEVRLATGFDPFDLFGIEAVDVNDDDHVDLLVANTASNEFSVLPGTGIGTFGPPTGYETCAAPERIMAADTDEDGMDDVLVACRVSGHVAVHPGTGSGTFPSAASRHAVGAQPWGIEAGDLDGDGYSDLVVANLFDNDVSALISLGNGTFAPEIGSAAGTAPSAVGLGDFDENGDLDAIVTNISTDDISVLLGNGTGSFIPQTPIGSGDGPRSVVIGDFNGDQHLDAAVGNGGTESSELTILLGNGDGTFVVSSVELAVAPFAVAAANLNADSILDLVVVLRGAAQVLPLIGDGDGRFIPRTAVAVGAGPWDIAVGDLDDDGLTDAVVVSDTSGAVSILVGNGDGTFQAEQRLAEFWYPQAVEIQDLNGDRHLDVVIALYGTSNTPGDAVVVFPGRGDGTFHPARSSRSGLRPRGIAIFDAELDGKLDLAVSDLGDNQVTVLLNTGLLPPEIGLDADKMTVGWGPVFGAVSYNSYRGDLSQFVDIDQDGLPDGGYGSCRNAFDGSLTDTVFIDTETPMLREGFFYLVTWDDSGDQEKGVGTTSTGLPRTPPPCP